MYAVNLLAMHYDEMGQRAADGGAKEFAKALELIEEATSMDASCVELHLNKASFLRTPATSRRRTPRRRRASSISLIVFNSNCVGHMMRAGSTRMPRSWRRCLRETGTRRRICSTWRRRVRARGGQVPHSQKQVRARAQVLPRRSHAL